MKLVRILTLIAGFSSPLIIGTTLPVSGMSFVVWVWMFCTGLMAKGLIQGFVKPFMDIPVEQQVPEQQTKYLDIIRAAFLFSGLGFLISELVFFQMIGTISIALLLTGLGTHIGTHSISKNRWFFNE